MFTNAEVLTLFPTLIWRARLEDHETLNRVLEGEITRLEREEPMQPGFEFNAWQSNEFLHEREPFYPLAERVLAATQRALDGVNALYEDLYITSLWANVGRQGFSHRDHTHPNNYMSGVYYVKIPQGGGSIVFTDPRPQAHVIAPRIAEGKHYGQSLIRIEAEEGVMILFPSWLQHNVEINRGTEPRISIAFNVMLRGDIGVEMARARL